MRISHILTVAVFLSLAVVCSGVIAQSEDDPVWTTKEGYNKAVEEFRKLKNPSPEERLTLWREWKERFQTVIEQNPKSPHIGIARIKLLGLCNGLGELKQSQEILHDIISDAGSTREKIRWYNELGEVSRAEFLANQVQSEGKNSLDAFERAHTLYCSLPPEARNDDDAGGRQVVALCMAGDVSKTLGDHVKSATLYQTARELFQSSTESAARAVLVGYDLESIAKYEMVEWVYAKEESKALNCLEILSQLRPYRWPPSYYALEYAELQYKKNAQGFQNFVSEWLDQNALDERTPILMARLGLSYNSDGLYEKALPIYETLRNKHCGDFQKLEPDAFQAGHGGHYDEVLYELGVIYLRQGKLDEAEKVKNELAKLLPKSQWIEYISPDNFTADMVDLAQITRQPRKYSVMRIIFMVPGIVLILWGLYRFAVERKKDET